MFGTVIKGLSTTLAGGAALAVSPLAHALDAQDVLMFSKGPVSLRPQLAVAETYSDNIYYKDKNQVADLITSVSPGLRLQLGQDFVDANIVSLSYTLDQYYYADRTDQNATQHRFLFNTQLFPSRFRITGADRVDFLSSVLNGGFSGASGIKVDRTVMVDAYQIAYSITEKTAVYVEALHSSVDYQDDVPLYDTRTLSGTGGFEWRGLDRVKFFGETYYGQTELGKNVFPVKPPYTTFIGGFIGARGDFTERITGTVKAGYEVRAFSDNSKAGDSPVVESSLTYKPSEKTTLSMVYARRQQVSVQFVRAAYSSDSFNLGASQIVGSTGRFRVNAGVNFDFLAYEPSPSF